MARRPRLHVEGGLYHVMLRGNAGEDIFFAPQDRYGFYRLLQDGVHRFGYRVHGFCLMTNHVHLALQVGEVALAKIMQNLAFRYTRWINQRVGRAGHLFQGRYQALLVDAQAYLLELVRYIHLNPVRAGMVAEPQEYPWSAHRCYLGLEPLPWMSTDWVLIQFGGTVSTARRRYARFVADGMGLGYREEFHRGAEDRRLIGDERFAEAVLARTVQGPRTRISLEAIIRYVCESSGYGEAELRVAGRDRGRAKARALIGWIALTSGASALSEVAARFNRDISTLSRAVGNFARIVNAGGPKADALRAHLRNATTQA